MRRQKRFPKEILRKPTTEKIIPLPGMTTDLLQCAIVIGAGVFFDYTYHFLIRGDKNNTHAAAEMANTASLPSSLFHRFFSELTLNYADLKPLDFIGFTGRHFLKNAPTIDFYFFGGDILVCDF